MKIEDEILTCQYCPFQEYDFNNTKELGFGERYRIMFIGSSPAITSNKSKGSSRFDMFFNNLLIKVDIHKKDYYFTNLIKTSVPKNVEPSEEQIKHCFSHIIKEIMLVKPQIIVPLGAITRKPFGMRWPDSFKKVTFKIGDEKHRAVLYPLEHPGMLHYKPEKEEQYLKKLKKIFNHYKLVII